MIEWLNNLSFTEAILSLLALNLAIFLLSLLCGEWLVRRYRDRRVTAAPEPMEAAEVYLSIGCVLLNTLVAVVGWTMWKHKLIVLRDEFSWRVLRDLFVLLLVMDFLMYLLHRVAHLRFVFPIVHRTHHRYDRPRPINLFVLNPFEVLGFGTLWLIVISIYTCTWIGMLSFLTANLAFGTIGHLGVEPFPQFWTRLPIIKHLGSSTFHANHHQNEHVNFGFYTDFWDRLFGTMRH